MNIFEKIRLRRLDEARAQDEDRKDAARREDEERRVAEAEAAEIEAELQKEEAEDREREGLFKDERGRDEEERRLPDPPPRRPIARDVEMDPGWLDRWEAEGVMTPLSDQERAKLAEIDREDPVGRGQREMFLPREVLAIRAHSDRWVAEREQAKAAEPEPEQKKAAPQEPVVKEQEQEPDDELEM